MSASGLWIAMIIVNLAKSCDKKNSAWIDSHRISLKVTCGVRERGKFVVHLVEENGTTMADIMPLFCLKWWDCSDYIENIGSLLTAALWILW